MNSDLMIFENPEFGAVRSILSHQSGLLPQDEGETGRLPPVFQKREAETIN